MLQTYQQCILTEAEFGLCSFKLTHVSTFTLIFTNKNGNTQQTANFSLETNLKELHEMIGTFEEKDAHQCSFSADVALFPIYWKVHLRFPSYQKETTNFSQDSTYDNRHKTQPH